jgi:hypothetical protein
VWEKIAYFNSFKCFCKKKFAFYFVFLFAKHEFSSRNVYSSLLEKLLSVHMG